MKRWKRNITSVLLIVIVIVVIMYLFVNIPLKQWSWESNINIHTAYFSDLYTEAKRKLGMFSEMFLLNHINVTWIKQSGTINLESIGFSFIHKARSQELYDACTISFQTETVTLSYMRDEPKGICNYMNFPFVDTEVDPSSENSIIDFLNSVAIYVDNWFPTVTNPQTIREGSYWLLITGNPDGTVAITQTDDKGFAIR